MVRKRASKKVKPDVEDKDEEVLVEGESSEDEDEPVEEIVLQPVNNNLKNVPKKYHKFL